MIILFFLIFPTPELKIQKDGKNPQTIRKTRTISESTNDSSTEFDLKFKGPSYEISLKSMDRPSSKQQLTAHGERSTTRAPETPSDKPEFSPYKPEIPPYKPYTPTDEPDVPSYRPEIRPNEPETRPYKPEIPPYKPYTPTDEPDVPSYRPEIPPNEPETRPYKPEIPSYRPGILPDGSDKPTDDLDSQPNKPEIPSYRPGILPNDPDSRPYKPDIPSYETAAPSNNPTYPEFDSGSYVTKFPVAFLSSDTNLTQFPKQTKPKCCEKDPKTQKLDCQKCLGKTVKTGEKKTNIKAGLLKILGDKYEFSEEIEIVSFLIEYIPLGKPEKTKSMIVLNTTKTADFIKSHGCNSVKKTQYFLCEKYESLPLL